MSDLAVSPDLREPTFALPRSSLSDALNGGPTPGDIAKAKADTVVYRDQMKAAGADLVKSEETATAARHAAMLQRPPLPPPPPPPEPKTTNPVEAWGSLAMSMAILGSALTRRPLLNSLNAAADVMKAYKARDADAYKTAFDKWKAQSDYSLKLYEYQHEAYKDALEMIATDQKGAMALFRAHGAALGDPPIQQLAEDNKPAEIVSLMEQRRGALDHQKALTDNARRTGEVNQEVLDAGNAYRADPASPEAKQRYEAAQQARKDLQAQPAATPPAFGSENAILEQRRREWMAAPENAGKGEPPADLVEKWRGDLKRSEAVPAKQGYQILSDPTHPDAQGNPTQYQMIPGKPETAITMSGEPYSPGGAQKIGTGAAPNAKNLAARAFDDEIYAKTGKHATFADWARFSQETSGSQTGKLSAEAVKLMAHQYELGDPGAITSLPRGGPARIQVENQIAEDMKDMGDAASQIVMNRLRMAEARSAATTAGRVTMNTEIYAQEAKGAGQQVIETSRLFPRTDYPLVNTALRAYETNTGDPNIVKFGAAMNAFVNAYGKLSNPTGIGIHDADKARITGILDTRLSQGQIEAGVEQVIKEGEVVSNAARAAQAEVLKNIMPIQPGAVSPSSPATAGGAAATAGAPSGAGSVPTAAQIKTARDSGKPRAAVRAKYIELHGDAATFDREWPP